MRLPPRLIYQKGRGILLSDLRSETNHWSNHLEKKRLCPKKPMLTQITSVEGMMNSSVYIDGMEKRERSARHGCRIRVELSKPGS
jgi:hypothetical protein